MKKFLKMMFLSATFQNITKNKFIKLLKNNDVIDLVTYGDQVYLEKRIPRSPGDEDIQTLIGVNGKYKFIYDSNKEMWIKIHDSKTFSKMILGSFENVFRSIRYGKP